VINCGLAAGDIAKCGAGMKWFVVPWRKDGCPHRGAGLRRWQARSFVTRRSPCVRLVQETVQHVEHTARAAGGGHGRVFPGPAGSAPLYPNRGVTQKSSQNNKLLG